MFLATVGVAYTERSRQHQATVTSRHYNNSKRLKINKYKVRNSSQT